MANPFDQFDTKPAAKANANPFDQFDQKQLDVDERGIPLPAGAKARMAAEFANREPDQPRTLKNKIVGGLEAIASMATGATTGMLGAIGGALGGTAARIASGTPETPSGPKVEDAVGEGMQKLTYAPKTQIGREYLKNIADAINETGIQGLPIGPEIAVMGNLARPAARQVATTVGRAVEPDIAAVKSAASAVKNAATPKIDATRAELLAKADQYGIPITPDMMTDNKFVKIFSETMEKIPLSGSNQEAKQTAFNRALIKTIGGDVLAKKLTPDVFEGAIKKSGREIGDISKKTPIALDDDFAKSIASVLSDTERFNTSDVAKIVGSYADELASKAATNDGIIDGTAFRNINSKIGRQIRGTTNGDLKNALGDFQDVMHDALQRNISDPADLAVLMDARKRYAIAKTVEPLVAKSVNGNISPAGLLARVNSNALGKAAMAQGNAGEIGELARIGQLLKEPNSSNTAERALTYGLLGGGAGTAAYMNPVAAAGTYTAANLYNRLSPILSRRIVGKSLPEPVAPVAFPNELSLAEESAFAPRPVPPSAADVPYTGLLTAEQAPFNASTPQQNLLATRPDIPSVDFPLLETGGPLPIQRAGERAPLGQDLSVAAENGIDFYGNQAAPAAVPVQERGLLSLIPQEGTPVKPLPAYETIDFPLRQEVLQQPEVVSAVNAFRSEAARLQQIAENAISPQVRAKATRDLVQLQAEFGQGMKMLGIGEAAEAHGLNRPLYEVGTGQKLQITKTMDRVARQRAQQQTLTNIGQAKTIDEAISAAGAKP